MSKRNAVIRKLTAVETLGCAQIICSDKTGTLTQNRMTVTEYFSPDENFLAKALALCCDAKLSENNVAIGEPTESALIYYALELNIDIDKLSEEFPRVDEIPFDSARKMMSTVHKDGEGYVEYTKGATGEILKICTHFLKDNQVVPMSVADKNIILMKTKEMAGNALRVLASAYKQFDETPGKLEQEMIFIGLVGIIDPIRPEAFAAIAECKEAGIRPIMITGDHRDTAIAIAKQLGLITDESEVLTGAELDEISDEEFEKTIGNYSVYARVKPENKVRIVSVWQKNGFICAMTGDGVNDAPSIKKADIGVGMGITGTDVTKNVADMVLADDNFATIVGAVGEGRKIYDNIKKTIQFLLSSNLSEVISIFVATLLGFVILRPVHILWINLITDAFPALALGMEKGEADIMKRSPRDPKESVFANGLGIDVIWQGIMVSVVTLAAYFVGHFMESGRWEIVNSADGITMAFLTMSMAEIFHSFNLRSARKSIFSIKKQNFYLWGSMILSLILSTIVIYIPFLRNAFEFEFISTHEYFTAMALAISVIPIVEIVKFVRNSLDKRK
jgi:Ca2+-transporting ATPase